MQAKQLPTRLSIYLNYVKNRLLNIEDACSKSESSFQVMKCELSRYDEWYLAGPEK